MSIFDDISPVGPSIETLRLERRRYGVSDSVGISVLQSIRFAKEFEQDIFERMVYKLEAEVLAEKLPPETINESRIAVWDFPRSSWQHFKLEHSESWWLGWLVRRRPVQCQVHDKQVTLTVNLERYRTFPQANVNYPPELGPYVQVAYLNKSWSEW